MTSVRERKGWLFFSGLIASSLCVLLIGAGALVTTTQSGDAIPDWPLSYQRLIPPYLAGGVVFEWTHRMIAALTGLSILALTIAVWVGRTPTFWRVLGTAALLGVIVQAGLGGLRVLIVSDPQVQTRMMSVLPVADPDSGRLLLAIGHALLAQLVLSTVFAVTSLIGRGTDQTPPQKGRVVSGASLLVFLLFVQLLLGALIRHLKAGLVVPDFPTSFGHLILPLTSLPYDPANPERWTYGEFAVRVYLQLCHRFNGLLILITAVSLFWKGKRWKAHGDGERLLLALLTLLFVQVVLGGLVVWTDLSLPVAILHTVVGAACLGLSVSYLIRSLVPLAGLRTAKLSALPDR